MIRAAIPAALLCLALPSVSHADILEVRDGGTVAVLASDRGLPTAANLDTTPAEPGPDVPAAALTMLAAPATPLAYQASLTRAAEMAGVSPALLEALVWQESRWHADALSPKGARGLTQLMPATARALAVDPLSAEANLAGGARYLRAMLDRFGGDVERALAAYNAGPGRVARAAGIPAIAETRAYVSAIIDRLGR